MKNIDLEIYKQKLVNAVDFNALGKEFQLNEEKLAEKFNEELEIIIESNHLDNEDPTLDEEQFSNLIMTSVTQLHIEALLNEGLLQANFDVEEGENLYTLTKKGKKAAEKFQPSYHLLIRSPAVKTKHSTRIPVQEICKGTFPCNGRFCWPIGSVEGKIPSSYSTVRL